MGNEISVGGSFGPSLPTVKLQNVGDVVQGVVTSVNEIAEKDFTTGQPKYWSPQGGAPVLLKDIKLELLHLYTPIKQWVIELDGDKKIFVKGDLLAKTKKAVREAGADAIKVGGQWAGKLTEKKENPKGKPSSVHEAKYVAPQP